MCAKSLWGISVLHTSESTPIVSHPLPHSSTMTGQLCHQTTQNLRTRPRELEQRASDLTRSWQRQTTHTLLAPAGLTTCQWNGLTVLLPALQIRGTRIVLKNIWFTANRCSNGKWTFTAFSQAQYTTVINTVIGKLQCRYSCPGTHWQRQAATQFTRLSWE